MVIQWCLVSEKKKLQPRVELDRDRLTGDNLMNPTSHPSGSSTSQRNPSLFWGLSLAFSVVNEIIRLIFFPSLTYTHYSE
jgi:hypothetical protein